MPSITPNPSEHMTGLRPDRLAAYSALSGCFMRWDSPSRLVATTARIRSLGPSTAVPSAYELRPTFTRPGPMRRVGARSCSLDMDHFMGINDHSDHTVRYRSAHVEPPKCSVWPKKLAVGVPQFSKKTYG